MPPRISPEQYFAAAMTTLAAEGAGGLRIGSLCAALGVTSGSFYHHFGSWAGFVRALLEHWEAEQTDRVVALARTSSAEPAVRIEVLKRLTVELPHAAEAAIRAWAAADADVAAAQRRVDAHRRAELEQILRGVLPGTDAARLAVFGMSLLVGFQQTHDPSDVAMLRALFDDYQELILRRAAR